MQPPIKLILGMPLSIFLIRIPKQRIGQDIFTDLLDGFFIPINMLIVVALRQGYEGSLHNAFILFLLLQILFEPPQNTLHEI